MTTLHVFVGPVTGRATTGATMPVPDSHFTDSETLTGTDTSTIVGQDGAFWTVTAGAVAKWVAFGETPDATQDPRDYIPANGTRSYVAHDGDKVATIDVV